MSGKTSRTKGHSYEREIVKRFKKLFPNARRHLEYQSSEATGDDIAGTGPLRIQCKRGKRYSSIGKIKEIQGDHGIHCLVTKGDREKDIICLYLDDFIAILDDIGVVYEE